MKAYDLLPIVLEGLLGRLARKTCLDDLLGRIARRTWETCLGYLLGRLIWIYTCKTCFSHWDQIECAMFSSICQLSGSTKITRPLLHQTTWPACTELCTSGGVNTRPRHIQLFAPQSHVLCIKGYRCCLWPIPYWTYIYTYIYIYPYILARCQWPATQHQVVTHPCLSLSMCT